jgi:beta-glucosidase
MGRGRSQWLLCVAASALCAIANPATAQAEPAAASNHSASNHSSANQSATSQSASARAIEARIDDLIARMSQPHKVAQLIQPDISTITPDDMRRYRFGSYLNGGNSGPGGDDKAPPPAWLALADAYWAASTAPLPDGEPAIPAIWGTDAVHGHNNIVGATLFPHNIALGAANDADLIRRIGAATAAEIATTGIDWAFAPTLAVARDTRWGRSYESYSEDPARVARLGPAMVEGLQGSPGTPGFLDQSHVLATIKHFLGDGGTGGIDRGDTTGPIDDLIRVHGAGYAPSIAAGAQTVMASFSSINGVKMHGNRDLLTGLLRDRLHFDGLVVGDWNGHGLVPGCTNTDCPQALMAGLDVFMVPEDWRGLYETTLREVEDGTIPMARIDQAVRRVLRVKLRDGLFDKPRPSARALGGQWAQLGSAQHRALAREAVRKSLVLLKNDGVLPLRAGAHVLVAGRAADSVARQSGGWTISWQGGGDLARADFPGATSIQAGLAEALRATGGSVELSSDGHFAARPDAAVVVFGEAPYAEYAGDSPDHALHDAEGLRLLRAFRAAHVPTVAVLLSGRPLWISRELDLADAFVAAWLPGSEGEGVADVLVGDAAGQARYDFTGRLPFHWPSTCRDDAAPAWPVGAGGSYAQAPHVPPLVLACAAPAPAATTVLFHRALGADVAVSVRALETDPPQALPALVGNDGAGVVNVSTFDAHAQEDGRRIEWRKGGSVSFALPGAIPAKGHALVIEYQPDPRQTGAIRIAAECAGCDAGTVLPTTPGKQPLRIPLACLGSTPVTAVRFTAPANAVLRLVSATIVTSHTPTNCSKSK